MTNPFRSPEKSAPPSTGPDEAVMAKVAEIQSEGPPPEILVSMASQAKAAMDEAKAEYERLRIQLWEAVGRKGGQIPGTKAKFTAPSTKPTRKVDYAALEAEYPDAYEAVVTLTPPSPDSPGRLYLS